MGLSLGNTANLQAFVSLETLIPAPSWTLRCTDFSRSSGSGQDQALSFTVPFLECFILKLEGAF